MPSKTHKKGKSIVSCPQINQYSAEDKSISMTKRECVCQVDEIESKMQEQSCKGVEL
jgi:hypothetical protein